MRLFNHLPLAVQHGDLPRPWVMPSWMPRAHRDALGAMLAEALRALDPSLKLAQLGWSERHYLLGGRLSLPSAVLVWWRVNAVPVVAPEVVVLEGSKLTPGLPLFDFDAEARLPAEAWLSPLKMRALHRLQDRLFDERPVAASEEIADALGELAATLVSPIDLVTAAEAMVEVAAQAGTLASARAEAVAQVIALRFGPAADAAVKALVAVGRGQELGEEGCAALRRAGLWDGAGSTPLLEMAREEEVLRRTVLRIAREGGITTDAAGDLVAGIFPAPRAPAAEAVMGMSPTQAPTATEVSAPPPLQPSDPAVREAWEMFIRGERDAGVGAVLRAMQERRDAGWGTDDTSLAGNLLLVTALAEDMERGQSLDAGKLERIASLYETAGDLFLRSDLLSLSAGAMLSAAYARALSYRWSDAEALYERSRALASKDGNRALQARCFRWLAEMRIRLDRPDEALVDAAEAARIFRELGSSAEEGESLRGLGDANVALGRLDAANEAYQKALAVLERAHQGNAGVLLSLGRLQQSKTDLRGARETIEKAVAAARDSKARLLEGLAHQALGDLSLRRNEVLRAREAYEEAASIYHELRDLRGEATVLERLGDVQVSMNEPTSARDAYDTAISLVRELQLPSAEAALLGKRAGVRAASGDADGARSDHVEALRIYEALGDVEAQARALMSLGAIDSRAERWEDAARWHRRAAELCRGAGMLPGLHAALKDLATTLWLAGRRDEAKQAAVDTLAAAQSLGDAGKVSLAELLIRVMDEAPPNAP